MYLKICLQCDNWRHGAKMAKKLGRRYDSFVKATLIKCPDMTFEYGYRFLRTRMWVEDKDIAGWLAYKILRDVIYPDDADTLMKDIEPGERFTFPIVLDAWGPMDAGIEFTLEEG